MNMNQLAKYIAQLETGKKQISIAQIKEILRIVAECSAEDVETLKAFLAYGSRNNMKKNGNKSSSVK